MTLNSTKFTVVIPTRDRCETLYYCLRSVIAQNYENLIILVSDNASTDRTAEVVRELSDPRIQYINTGSRLGMSQNWEFALGHITDGWVTFLGDDDGMVPDSLAYLDQVIRKTGCAALTSGYCSYAWPGIGEGCKTTVQLGSGYTQRDSAKWLARVVTGKSSYHQLPWLYHGGFASIDLINKARAADGRFFRSMTPDLYSAVALATVTTNYLRVHRPVAVEGVSRASTGGSTFGFVNDSGPSKKYYSENNLPFHPKLAASRLPKSLEILVYECYLQTEDLVPQRPSVKIEGQLGLALARTPERFREETLEYIKILASRLNLKMWYISLLAQQFRLLDWLNGLLKGVSEPNVYSSYGAENVFEASLVASKIVRAKQAWRTRCIDRLFFLADTTRRRVYYSPIVLKLTKHCIPDFIRIRLKNLIVPPRTGPLVENPPVNTDPCTRTG